MRTSRIMRLMFAVTCLTLSACYQRMAVQPSYHPLEATEFFADGRSSRPPVAGTVARGQLRTDRALYEGADKDGKTVTEFPYEITKEVLARGRQRYEIFCSVCHGYTGQGDGRIAQRGFTKPPSYTKDYSRAYDLKSEKKDRVLLVDAPVGHIYDVITRGYGAMPDHAEQIPVHDRWAIVGYVRALQYSQLPEMREKMKAGPKGGKK